MTAGVLLLIARGLCPSQGTTMLLRELWPWRGSSLLLLVDNGVPSGSISEVSKSWMEAHAERSRDLPT